MIAKYKCIIVLMAFLICRPLFSTGPSSVTISIIPIARNSSGQILCKTSYTSNPMGAHMPMPVSYNLCVVSDEGIIEAKSFASYEPDYNEMDEELTDLKYYSKLFEELSISSENDVIEYFIEKYAFTIPIEIKDNEYQEFIIKQSEYKNVRVVSIGNRNSTELHSPKINVYYKYENIYFMINSWSSWMSDSNTGAVFDEGEEYDGYYIDGILILNNGE